ncbi:MAG: biopolymer transporter ExbD [bacterium]|nr:biopolymer transporter ExbD [bacterium]
MLDLTYRRKLDASMNMTPMIDIVFQLLIFFLLTTNFITTEGIQVKLPQAKAAAAQIQEEITVFISREGRVFLQQQELNEGQLQRRLQTLIAKSRNKLVIVKADREIAVNKAVKVMDIAKRAGAERLCIATDRD